VTQATGYKCDYRVLETKFKTLVKPLDKLNATFTGTRNDAKFFEEFASHLPNVLEYLRDNVTSACEKDAAKARSVSTPVDVVLARGC
jgi:hypothetical protein